MAIIWYLINEIIDSVASSVHFLVNVYVSCVIIPRNVCFASNVTMKYNILMVISKCYSGLTGLYK